MTFQLGIPKSISHTISTITWFCYLWAFSRPAFDEQINSRVWSMKNIVSDSKWAITFYT
jgi:hypothetical protein